MTDIIPGCRERRDYILWPFFFSSFSHRDRKLPTQQRLSLSSKPQEQAQHMHREIQESPSSD